MMYSAGLSRAAMAAMLGSVLGLTAIQSQEPAVKPCAGPEYRQFDFWIGEWTVTGADGKLAGSNRIEPIAGGCGLQETWTAGFDGMYATTKGE